jgi:O-antigen/teichoic acid export membrane protein/glycosyltransferase involved in cell wall biosynthesis
VKVVALPRDPNPYQERLYSALASHGVRVRYAAERTPSHTLNLLLLPLELALARLAGWRVLHLHWTFGFALPGSGRFVALRRLSAAWFYLVLGVARLLGMRIVWTAHNVLPHEPVFHDDAAARRRLVAASDLVLAHSDGALEGLRGLGAEPSSAAVVPLASVVPHAPAELPERPAGAPLRVLFLGKVLAYKGVEDLLAALSRLPAGVEVEATVAGATPERALRERLEELGGATLRLEHVPDEELTRLLADCDVVVLPFRRVTTSTSVLHAMSHGRAVVLPDLPAFRDLPPRAAIRYDGSVDGLARTLADLARADRAELVAAGRAAAEHARGLTWELVAERTVAALRGDPPPSPAPAPPGEPAVAAAPGRLRERVGGVLRDELYSGSLLLLANTVLLAAFGLLFWALAARLYSQTSVGLFSGVSSAVVLLGTVASLGLPNTMLRHLAGADRPRELVAASLVAVLALGGGLCVAAVELLGPRLPDELELQDPAGGTGLVVALVAVTAANALTDAGLVAVRQARLVLLKNLGGSVAKVAAVAPLADEGTTGLVLAYGAGTALSALLGAALLLGRLSTAPRPRRPAAVLRRHLSFSAGNYAGVVMGIVPLTVVPLIVLAERGAREAAWFAIAYLLVGTVNFIPSATSQALFAEVSRGSRPLREQVVKALKGVYALLLPAALVLFAAAPLVLELFGDDYREGATGCLRALAAGTLFTGGTYLVDVLLTARDRVGAYAFMNGLNATLVVVAVAVLAPHGLTETGLGWTAAQGVSLAAGLVLLTARRARTS